MRQFVRLGDVLFRLPASRTSKCIDEKRSAGQVDKFRRLARFVIDHHFGSRPARIKYKSAGLSNYVFEAQHADGDFIVRISPDKSRLDAFIKEHWAERAARKAGVPTAEILETGVSIIPYPYVIARSVDGLESTDHPNARRSFASWAG